MIASVKWVLALFSRQLLPSKRLAIAEACLIGLVSGLAAVLLGQGVGWLGGLRQHFTHVFPAYIALPVFGLVGGLLAGWWRASRPLHQVVACRK